MSKDNPRSHRVVITFGQSNGMEFQVWSYQVGRIREFHIALVGPDTHTIVQGKFRIRAALERTEGRG